MILRTTTLSLSIFTVLLAAACGGGRGDGNGGGLGGGGGNDPNMEQDAAVDPAVEICNGSDDNGDGRVDEGCPCDLGESQSCFPGAVDQPAWARCQLGVQACKAGDLATWDTCEGFKECDLQEQVFIYGETENVRPVDIVIVVDQSGSMSEEIAQVQANLNTFAQTIASSGIDYHVIVLARRTPKSTSDKYSICIDPPLAGPGCADNTRFRQIDEDVQSNDALSLVQENILAIEGFMRQDSLREFIVITDDDAGGYGGHLEGQPFHDWLVARPGFQDYVFNGVVCLQGSCGIGAEGKEYKLLSMLTNGVIEDVESPNWAMTFQNFASNIISKTLFYELNEEPFDVWEVAFLDPDTGTEISQPRGVAWDYKRDTNSIVLFDGFTPEAGTKIIVRYQRVL
ncbi:MAG: hypothetical protein KC416_08085 [Myxococcales bacterium]|nr:hypothetical protein [Myxococcales bacterium]